VEEAERIRAFGRELDDRLAERTVATGVGDALFVDALPNVYMLNYLRADRGSSAEVAGAAERVLEAFHHRKVFTYLGLDLGWQRSTHLVMLHRRKPDRRVDTAHVRPVSFEEIASLRMYDYDDAALGQQMNEAQRRVGRAIDVEWLAVFDGAEPAAWCHVRSWNGVAQIEDVNTLPSFRRRGHGRPSSSTRSTRRAQRTTSSTSRRSRRTGRATCTPGSGSTRSIAATTTSGPVTR